MRARASSAVLVAAYVLSGCHTPLLRDADRDLTCGAGVAMAPDAVTFKANPMADPVGGPAIGVGLGALSLVAALANPLGFIMAPAAVYAGITCGEGARKHPTADADFRRIFGAADPAVLPRAIAQRLGGDSCQRHSPGAKAMVVVERVEAVPGCTGGDSWGYALTVFWHVNRADGTVLVPSRSTKCVVRGERDVDAWFADASSSQKEVESALTAIGVRLAADLTGSEPPEEICQIYLPKGNSVEPGEPANPPSVTP